MLSAWAVINHSVSERERERKKERGGEREKLCVMQCPLNLQQVRTLFSCGRSNTWEAESKKGGLNKQEDLALLSETNKDFAQSKQKKDWVTLPTFQTLSITQFEI